MENTASPLDLFTLLEIALEERDEAADAFDVFKQDAAMHAPPPEMGGAPAPSSDDAAEIAAQEVDAFSAEVRGLLAGASDTDLLDAYRQSGGTVGHPTAEALLGEIKRRNLAM